MIVDSEIGNIVRCQKQSDRKLWQLGGIWEIYSGFAKAEPDKLGVCKTYFNLDQAFHKSGSKMIKSVEQSMITVRRCLFCNLDFHILFNTWKIMLYSFLVLIGKNIIIPCISQFSCSAIHENRESFIFKKIVEKNPKSLRYICQICFNKNGGHIHIPPGQGKAHISCINKNYHDNDTEKSLELIGKWILNVAKSQDTVLKNQLLYQLSHSLMVLNSKNFNIFSTNTLKPKLFKLEKLIK